MHLTYNGYSNYSIYTGQPVSQRTQLRKIFWSIFTTCVSLLVATITLW